MTAGVVPVPRDVRNRGGPGSNSRTLAVAATSTLTATPDAFVTGSMPRPLLHDGAGFAPSEVGARGPARANTFRPEFPAGEALMAGPAWLAGGFAALLALILAQFMVGCVMGLAMGYMLIISP